MTKRPKILYLVHFYHNRGGVEEHVRALAKGLNDEFELYILAPEEGRLVLIQDGRIIRSYSADKVAWPISPYRQESLESATAQVITEIEPDIIHVQHFLHWHVGVFEQLLSTKIPVVLTFHDYFVITPFYTMQGAGSPEVALTKEYCELIFQADISEYVNKRFNILKDVLNGCRAFICPSKSLSTALSSLLPLEFRVIEHGIESFTPEPSSVANTTTRFGFLGSKLPQKGWMELLKAFQVLRQELPNIELSFFGGGQGAPAASPGVSFHPSYGQEDLPRIMSQFDVGVIPSLFPETYSYVLSELWMAGKPVAASRIGSLAERVEEGKTGRLFTPGDISAMIEALRWYAESTEWREWKIARPRLLRDMLEDYRVLYRSFAK